MNNKCILGLLLFLCGTILSHGSSHVIQIDSEEVERLLQAESENQQLVEIVFQLEQECARLKNIVEAQELENNDLRVRIFELESILNLQDAFDSDDETLD